KRAAPAGDRGTGSATGRSRNRSGDLETASPRAVSWKRLDRQGGTFMVRSGGGASRELAPLLGAKLLPPAPGPFHLSRPRLHDRLASGLEGRATIVLAGP